MAFEYRKLDAADAEQWQVLRLEGARNFPLGFLVTAQEAAAASVEQCRQILANGNSRGVFDGAKLVGFCGYRPERLERTRHRGELGPFFVAREYQGSGAAQRLMRGVVEEARESGIEQLELYVDTKNHRAIAFYERQGFERIAIHPDCVRSGGISRDGYFCRLRIA